jgi:quinol monooxygenase YgiN
MDVVRWYRMEAAEGQAEALREALMTFAQAVKALPGCLGIELLRDVDSSDCFVFIERWNSVNAHKEASHLLSKESLNPVMEALKAKPISAVLDSLLVG